MQTPQISVVIPVYKTEQYLDKCVRSVLDGAFRDIEVLLIDDGSPGGAACDRYMREDGRVRVIHQENKGLSAARNEGIRQAGAPYIGFVDSDDWILPRMYEELYRLIKEHGADIVSCGFTQYIISGHSKPRTEKKKELTDPKITLMNGRDAFKRLLISDKTASHIACGKLYKRQLFEDITYPEGRVYEDAATTYKLYFKAENVVHTDARYYCYAVRNGSITNSKFTPASMDKLTAADEILGFVRGHCPELTEYAACFQIVTALRLAADFTPEIIKQYPTEYAAVKEILLNPENGKNRRLALRHKLLLLIYKRSRPVYRAVWARKLKRRE